MYGAFSCERQFPDSRFLVLCRQNRQSGDSRSQEDSPASRNVFLWKRNIPRLFELPYAGVRCLPLGYRAWCFVHPLLAQRLESLCVGESSVLQRALNCVLNPVRG